MQDHTQLLGKASSGWLGWFLLPVPNPWPGVEVKVLPPILRKNSVLLWVSFWGSVWVNKLSEDEAEWLK